MNMDSKLPVELRDLGTSVSSGACAQASYSPYRGVSARITQHKATSLKLKFHQFGRKDARTLLPQAAMQPFGRAWPVLEANSALRALPTVICSVGETLKDVCYGAADAGELKECPECGRSYLKRHFQNVASNTDGRSAVCRGCIYQDKLRRSAKLGRINKSGYPPTDEAMQCSNCGQELPANFFIHHPKCKSGRHPYCQACLSEYAAMRSKKLVANVPLQKACNGPLCKGAILPADKFPREKGNINGLQAFCKKCKSFRRSEELKNAREVPYGRSTADEQAGFCTQCEEIKPATEFYVYENKRTGRHICKACTNLRNRMDSAARRT